ncbi:MAG: outer rane beta-barrel protein [Flavipsychrobacter sp.]|nr:outer rane beta-barrel protein [Flavipsychrobacter sp.]
MRYFILSLVMCLSLSQAFASGKITGKITDGKNGETVIGAIVTVQGSPAGAATDMDGNFVLSVDAGTYTISVKYVGYQDKEIDGIIVTDGVETNVNVLLTAATNELKEVVVQTSVKKENISAMILYQKNTNTVAQVVSAEAIRKSPDRNTGEVLKRISSASIQEGKYLIIRGLGDRYNQAMLNGSLLSSTEPDRKTFSFDLFPSGMIDNIVINKAATPDLPGEFAGGLIQVNTKDIPSSNFFTIQVGSGVNSQTIGNDFYYNKGGKTDWLGIDDGTRAVPASMVDKDKFRELSVDEKNAIGKDFKNDWSYQKKAGMPNASMQASGGLNTRLMNKKFGAIFAVNYNKQNRKTDITRAFYNQTGAIQKTLDYNEQSYTEEVLAGALANLSLELNNNNRISFKNLFNINGMDNTLLRSGRNNDYGADVNAYQLAFKSTQYLTSQLVGAHYIESSKIKVNWNTSYVRLYQNQPNLRRMEYRKPDGDSVYYASVQSYLPSLNSASRFYSKLTDNIVMGSVDAAKQFKIGGMAQSIKTGYMVQSKGRVFNSRPFGMTGGSNENNQLGAGEIFAPANIGVANGYNLSELSDKDYDYTAASLLNAGFLMFDNAITEKLRAVWGVRYENYDQQLNGFRSNKPVNLDNNTGDFLPSVNLTYKANSKTNLRFCASQTVIRPEFRELSPFTFYDFEILAAVQGNPDLKRTKITNLDLRYELYPRSGELITAGVFYKKFINPIEQFYNESGVNTFSFTYGNAPSAASEGVELEFRKHLDFIPGKAFKPFTVFANVSYILNKVNFTTTDVNGNEVKSNRPMQGQSPYVINSGLQYDGEASGTSASLLFNMIGRRIYLVGNEQSPSIWEAPRPLFDFMVSQKIMKKKADIKFTITDILNQKANFYQDKNDNGKYDSNTDFLRISRLTGTTYSISFLYNLR